MVWTYVKEVYRFIAHPNWVTFGEVFPNIWAASAFKGMRLSCSNDLCSRQHTHGKGWLKSSRLYHIRINNSRRGYQPKNDTINFTGAFGETLTVPSAKGHLENNLAWLEVIEEQKSKFSGQFRGLVITGWQRYDHFATLAETFPAGFPSLILNLVCVTAGGYTGKESYVRMQLSKVKLNL